MIHISNFIGKDRLSNKLAYNNKIDINQPDMNTRSAAEILFFSMAKNTKFVSLFFLMKLNEI